MAPKARPLVFLPDIFIKLVRPGKPVPNNVAVFHVPQKMTKFDIKNYLQSIYNVPVQKVHTVNVLGKTKHDPVTRKPFKRPDFKKAYVFLAKGQTFKFPVLYKAPPPKPEAPSATPQEDPAEAAIRKEQASQFEY